MSERNNFQQPASKDQLRKLVEAKIAQEKIDEYNARMQRRPSQPQQRMSTPPPFPPRAPRMPTPPAARPYQGVSYNSMQQPPTPSMTQQDKTPQSPITPPSSKVAEKTTVSAENKKPAKTPNRLSKKSIRVLGGIAALVVVGGGVFVAARNGVLPLGISEAASDLGNGSNITQNDHLGAAVLSSVLVDKEGSADQKIKICEKPESVIITMSIDGDIPLVPILPQKDKDGKDVVAPISPYLDQKTMEKSLTADELKEMEPFETDDGFPHMTVKDLPVYLNACITGDNAVTQNADGSMTINRSDITVTASDPNQLFEATDLIATPVSQKDSSDPETNKEKGQYLTMPNRLFISHIDGYDAFNTALDALVKKLSDPTQNEYLLYSAESSALQQINDPTDGEEDINYPDGKYEKDQPSLAGVIDRAIVTHYGGDDNTVIRTGGGNTIYNVALNAPVSATTKKSVLTEKIDTGLEPKPFKLTNVDVDFGAPTKPKSASITTSTPETKDGP